MKTGTGILLLAGGACSVSITFFSIVEVLLISSLPFLVSATLGITLQYGAIRSKGSIYENIVCLCGSVNRSFSESRESAPVCILTRRIGTTGESDYYRNTTFEQTVDGEDLSSNETSTLFLFLVVK